MKSFVCLLALLAISGCKDQTLMHGKFDIEWAGNHYACIDGYDIEGGFYKFKSLSSSADYIVPDYKIDSIKVGCTYYK